MTVEVKTLDGTFEMEETYKNLLDHLALDSISSKKMLYTAFSLGHARGVVEGLAAARKVLTEMEFPL